MLRLASADIVVSLDDDSYPVEPDFLARLRRVLEAHPEAAVVSFAEIRDDARERPLRSRSSPAVATSRPTPIAAPPCVETSISRLAGFPSFFGHMYEEPDYALQCYAAGFAVWFEPDLAVRHHMSSVNRHEGRRQRLHARNELWSVLIRCPWPYLPAVALFRIWRQLRYAATQGPSDVLLQPAWWLSALRGLPQCLATAYRDPVADLLGLDEARPAPGRSTARAGQGDGRDRDEIPRPASDPRRGRHHRPVSAATF